MFLCCCYLSSSTLFSTFWPLPMFSLFLSLSLALFSLFTLYSFCTFAFRFPSLFPLLVPPLLSSLSFPTLSLVYTTLILGNLPSPTQVEHSHPDSLTHLVPGNPQVCTHRSTSTQLRQYVYGRPPYASVRLHLDNCSTPLPGKLLAQL